MFNINKLVNELVTESFIKQNLLKEGNKVAISELKKQFVIDCIEELGLKKPPKIIFTKNKSKLETLAHFDLDKFEVVVYSKGRLMADVFRSLAHELKHTHQLETGVLNFENWEEAGKTGSDIENDANSFSGIMLRKFGKKFPEINELQFTDEDLGENFSNYDIISKINEHRRVNGNFEKYSSLLKVQQPVVDSNIYDKQSRANMNDTTLKNKGNISKYDNILTNKKTLKEESHKHEFGCLMLEVPFENWQKVLSKISKEDLYQEENDDMYGLETEPHITVLYGLHEEVEEEKLINFVKEFCKNEEIDIQISKMGVFKTSKFEVLKLDVESSTLKSLNKQLSENFPYTSKFPTYEPHITIAYLKKGTSQKYLKELTTPISKSLNKFIYSKVDGSKEEFKIN